MKILIADDHALAREGMAQLLLSFQNNHSILETDTYAGTRECLTQHDDLDLILIDLMMPGEAPAEELRKIRNLAPAIPLIVVSASENINIINQVLEVGIQGFLPKTSSRAVIRSAINLVLSGGKYIPPEILNAKADQEPIPTENVPSDADLEQLTERQRDVLCLLANGLSNKDIARTLEIAEPTVRSHIASIFRILGVRNRTHASRIALDRGII